MTSEGHPPSVRRELVVPVGEIGLKAILTLPPEARGAVIFAHGSGSGRSSPRNRAVAEALADARLASLLIDLLTVEEDAEDRVTRRLRFDVGFLAERVIGAVDWLPDALSGDLPGRFRDLPIGCYGASTGAAAALIAAAERPDRVAACVSRGGRPDLAGDALARVTAPTLLIVGDMDTEVLALNREAQGALGGDSRLEVVPGAGHLFEEPGALAHVATLTQQWFHRHLAPGGRRAGPDRNDR